MVFRKSYQQAEYDVNVVKKNKHIKFYQSHSHPPPFHAYFSEKNEIKQFTHGKTSSPHCHINSSPLVIEIT